MFLVIEITVSDTLSSTISVILLIFSKSKPTQHALQNWKDNNSKKTTKSSADYFWWLRCLSFLKQSLFSPIYSRKQIYLHDLREFMSKKLVFRKTAMWLIVCPKVQNNSYPIIASLFIILMLSAMIHLRMHAWNLMKRI